MRWLEAKKINNCYQVSEGFGDYYSKFDHGYILRVLNTNLVLRKS